MAVFQLLYAALARRFVPSVSCSSHFAGSADAVVKCMCMCAVQSRLFIVTQ